MGVETKILISLIWCLPFLVSSGLKAAHLCGCVSREQYHLFNRIKYFNEERMKRILSRAIAFSMWIFIVAFRLIFESSWKLFEKNMRQSDEIGVVLKMKMN